MKSLLILLLFSMPIWSFGQHKKRFVWVEPTKKQLALAKKHDSCFYNNEHTAAQRRNFFPFNEAVTIKLISFDDPPQPNGEIKMGESDKLVQDTPMWDPTPVFTAVSKNKFTLYNPKVKEVKILTSAGVDSLTDILFNYGYTPVRDKDLINIGNFGCNCYNPTNAILFIDKNGNITQYMRACFLCGRHEWSSSKVKGIVYCTEKYEMLHQFFVANGIKFDASSAFTDE